MLWKWQYYPKQTLDSMQSLVVVQSVSRVQPFVTQLTTAWQASLSFTISRSLLKFMSIESVMPSNHLILCQLLLLPPSIFPSIRVFSNESVLPIRWPNYWSFNFSICPSNEYSGLISFRIDLGWWFHLLLWFHSLATVNDVTKTDTSKVSNKYKCK